MIPRRCFYCPEPSAGTRDHVFPRAMLRTMPRQSDSWYMLNTVPACDACNSAKADMPPERWLERLSGRYAERFAARLERLYAGRVVEAAPT